MDNRSAAALAMMLNGFPQSQNTEPNILLAGFSLALEGISSEAVEATCLDYMRGKVKDQKLDFSPSIPAFVKAASDKQWAIDYAKIPKIEYSPPPPEPPRDAKLDALISRGMTILCHCLKTGADASELGEANLDPNKLSALEVKLGITPRLEKPAIERAV